jgi:HAD superfamily hydrolase (TIGR01450 family)
MLDLDGVVYVGRAAVVGAAEHLRTVARAGMLLAYVTNNASRPPRVVAEHLTELGIEAAADDVVTSAQAAARLLADRLDEGAAVFVIGGEGLFEALDERGLRSVQRLAAKPEAVVSGYHPDLRWGTVIEGAIGVRDGLPWVASNTDMTVPTAAGPGPGNGVLVRAVAEYAEVTPVVAGKPEPPLFHETQRRVGGERPLVVGDRLDTDIEGARRAGYDSLLVMTGVTDLDVLVEAAPERRPTYVAAELSGLTAAHQAPERDGTGWRHDGWSAVVDDGRLLVEGEGSLDTWWQVVAAAAWSHLDATGVPVSTAGLAPPQPDVRGPGR